MKKNISYYPHHTESDQHAKFKMLRVEYGWEGEGKFWALNNRIAKAEDCCLDISKKYNKAGIASDLDFSLKDFDCFVLFLINDCELIRECGNGLITNDIIQETFEKVMRDRGAARARSKRTSPEKDKTSGEKTYKGKERKGKERKEEKTIVGQEPRPPRSKYQGQSSTTSNPQAIIENIIMSIPLNKKDTFFDVFQEEVDEWQKTFPAVDVIGELRKARLWSVNNPKKRKTKSGIRNHLAIWLGKAQDKPKPNHPQGTKTARQKNIDKISALREGLEDATGFNPYKKTPESNSGVNAYQNNSALPE